MFICTGPKILCPGIYLPGDVKYSGKTLKSKNEVAQINELLVKIVAYNLTVVIHEMYENRVKPSFIQS
jgi:hypothetical protein